MVVIVVAVGFMAVNDQSLRCLDVLQQQFTII